MSFLDRYEVQLAQASAELEVERNQTHRSRRGLRRRKVVIPAVVMAVAGPAAAVAVVEPWAPQVGRDGQHISTSQAPIAPAAKHAFGVLRRPQNASDRAIAEPVLRRLSRPLNGVQLTSVRAIRPGVAIVPIQALSAESGQAAQGPQICVVVHSLTGCSPVAQVAGRGIALLSAGRGRTRYVGVAPDKVARVRFVPVDGSEPTTADVVGNYFSLTVPGMAKSRRVFVPNHDGSRRTRSLPGPPIPLPGVLSFLDRSGQTIRTP